MHNSIQLCADGAIDAGDILVQQGLVDTIELVAATGQVKKDL
jgi:hypothetical protein